MWHVWRYSFTVFWKVKILAHVYIKNKWMEKYVKNGEIICEDANYSWLVFMRHYFLLLKFQQVFVRVFSPNAVTLASFSHLCCAVSHTHTHTHTHTHQCWNSDFVQSMLFVKTVVTCWFLHNHPEPALKCSSPPSSLLSCIGRPQQ